MNDDLRVEDFDYHLPSELIAQTPAEPRDSSRLMVVNRTDGTISHHTFRDLPQFLREGDVLVRNNTRVMAARVFGKRATGGKVEFLLMYREDGGTWKSLIKSRAKLKPPEIIDLDGTSAQLQIIAKEDGIFTLKVLGVDDLRPLLPDIGHMPLPPYIKRDYGAGPQEKDFQSYQTIYAQEPGAYAAPTAGLHFTDRVFDDLARENVTWEDVTLHVGLGTFLPVKVDNVADHEMHSEFYRISPDLLSRLQKKDRSQGRILCVGTTSLRALEAAWTTGETEGWTDIFIYPPYQIQSTDLLVTNFHLPQSTLLMLVAAMAGKDLIFRAYEEAVTEKYRFFSYGDAMLVV